MKLNMKLKLKIQLNKTKYFQKTFIIKGGRLCSADTPLARPTSWRHWPRVIIAIWNQKIPVDQWNIWTLVPLVVDDLRLLDVLTNWLGPAVRAMSTILNRIYT